MSPYIQEMRRYHLDKLEDDCRSPGELNYRITKIILRYLEHKVGDVPQQVEANYTDYNEVIGVLRLVELEFWDRLIRPFEKKKRELNGDVFE